MPAKRKNKKPARAEETDGVYFLKIVLYLILGSLWLKFSSPLLIGHVAIKGLPVGLVIGLIFASHDHFQVDRKIEYVLLIVVTVICYFVPAGILI